MILRRFSRKDEITEEEPRGFDSFELRLGDMMRGERATMGKSLLDVERELRIKASYVAAIENADPDAFDTPGFIPGYVRSYARYLGMDPDRAFAGFCAESGFSTAHGMSAAASSVRKPDEPIVGMKPKRGDDSLTSPNTPFIPATESLFSRIEPGAVGSVTVLLALIAAIGYGGWAVLNEVQRVQVAPVENTPDVLADLDPLQSVKQGQPENSGQAASSDMAGNFGASTDDTLDRLYRPEALDVPVMVARDAPISTLDPSQVGTLSAPVRELAEQTPVLSGIDGALAAALGAGPVDPPQLAETTPQVVAPPSPGVQMVAVRPAWVRVRAADGSVIFEGIMNAGDSYDVPATEAPPTLRVGESGAIYFRVNGEHYGPAGPRGAVTANLALAADSLSAALEVADLTQDSDLSRYVAELRAQDLQ
ncbi:helix-turn-helix domain-containing protein [Roseovarius spongiae]|uniref:Helix-turn-helix domain-containing protein n=1 Tax=Roseovarius spongiae TaxID=2320272 RepID=A0A3A8AWN7_9RHOB|nr:helix-turn-helix domain-containing protein [Roseovarius spongiae]RKF15150.1 helix-turn-helix domain-containing protein [Roseovarius spongiae]